MKSFLYNGAKATISINDDVVGAAFVASYSIETRASEIYTLDLIVPVEIAPDNIRVAMTLTVYRHPDNDPVIDGIAPGSPGSDNAQAAFTEAQYIKVEIKDNLGKTIFCMPKAWLMSRSGSTSAKEFIVETWNITGIGYLGPSN